MKSKHFTVIYLLIHVQYVTGKQQIQNVLIKRIQASIVFSQAIKYALLSKVRTNPLQIKQNYTCIKILMLLRKP